MNEQWMSALPLDNVNISPVSGDVNEAFKVTTVEEDIFLLVQRQRSRSLLCRRNCRTK